MCMYNGEHDMIVQYIMWTKMGGEEKNSEEFFFTKFYLVSFLTALFLYFCKRGGFLVDDGVA